MVFRPCAGRSAEPSAVANLPSLPAEGGKESKRSVPAEEVQSLILAHIFRHDFPGQPCDLTGFDIAPEIAYFFWRLHEFGIQDEGLSEEFEIFREPGCVISNLVFPKRAGGPNAPVCRVRYPLIALTPL